MSRYMYATRPSSGSVNFRNASTVERCMADLPLRFD
jgi:hypothetical protein